MFELLMLLTLLSIVIWSWLASPDTDLRMFSQLFAKSRVVILSGILVLKKGWLRHGKQSFLQRCRSKWLSWRAFSLSH